MDTIDMRVIDANAEAMGILKSSLMENAGKCIAEKVFEISKSCKVAIFAGTGGNGGDGFVAARHLLNKGFDVDIYLLGQTFNIKSSESQNNWKILQEISKETNSMNIHLIEDTSQLESVDSDITVDAILGTGTEGKLREPISSAVDIINNSNGIVIAVDIPTGLNPQTGKVEDKAVEADFTVTFHKKKSGIENAETKYVGSVRVCDIGIPTEAELFTGPGDLLRLKKREKNSHKGQNGRVLIVGGSSEYSGAPALAALSSLRSGADLSVIACPKSVASPIRSYSLDLIVKSLSDNYITFDDTSRLLELSEEADVMVLGCGIGREEETGLALNEMIEKLQVPIIIDADALKILDLDVISKYRSEIILTPHKAEFKAFFGIGVPENLNQKIDVVSDASRECKCTVLLKGVVDIISNGESVKLNSTGNPGMTVGGTGDLLAGIVGSLMAQGHNAYEAAYLGSFINGSAGDIAKKDFGYNFLASDILKYIPRIFRGN
jgi:ADP-dependent NAD(P)H-hydrate dehydratase / NAD(P)H-hydrate epimerase